MSLRIFIIIFILLAIDFYVFQGVKLVLRSSSVTTQKITYMIFWAVTFISVSIILLGFFTDWHSWNKVVRTYSFALIVIVYMSKIFVVLFLLVDDVLRIFRWIGSYIADTFFS